MLIELEKPTRRRRWTHLGVVVFCGLLVLTLIDETNEEVFHRLWIPVNDGKKLLAALKKIYKEEGPLQKNRRQNAEKS
jgi:hypothetical protein